MKKDLYKRLIVDWQQRDLSYVIDRDIPLPLDIKKIISIVG